jgi:hypothetical protein
MLTAGCASLSPAKPEEVVRDRAQARWNALIAGEWDKAYSYMTPSYRAVVEQKRYPSRFSGSVSWLAAEVVRVDCAEQSCTVRMKVTFRPVLGGRPGSAASTGFDETWVFEDGQWWMFEKL